MSKVLRTCKSCGPDTIFRIINKRQWVCCKCTSAKVMQARKRKKEMIHDVANRNKCSKCGNNNQPNALRLIPKDPNVGPINYNLGIKKLKEILSKYELLCANCIIEKKL